eukprot:symbB.v1.2.014532.t1/scaffold1031.1/size143042/7
MDFAQENTVPATEAASVAVEEDTMPASEAASATVEDLAGSDDSTAEEQWLECKRALLADGFTISEIHQMVQAELAMRGEMANAVPAPEAASATVKENTVPAPEAASATVEELVESDDSTVRVNLISQIEELEQQPRELLREVSGWK